MALAEATRLRKGDIVALHGTVKYDDSSDGHVFLDVPGATSCMVAMGDIQSIVRRNLQIGDLVRSVANHKYKFLVQGVSPEGDNLWLLRQPVINQPEYVTSLSGALELYEVPSDVDD